MITEQGLRGRPHTEPLCELFASAVGDPGHLRCKTLHMILLLLKKAFGYEQGHINVFMAGFLEPPVQITLDTLPDGIAVGTDDHAAPHA